MCSCEQGTCAGNCPCGCLHTAPKHRANVRADSCSAVLGYPHAPDYVTCTVTTGGKRRAEASRVL